MKKEKAIAKLSNTKVYVDGKSKEIQEKLFELGFRWASNSKEVSYTNKPFILISSQNMYLTTSSDMLYFRDDKYKEIKANDILSITIDKEYDLKPFDKVLVRDNYGEVWCADFFSHMQEADCKFVAVSNCWRYCIPFEGNEHLVGTSDSPDKD